MKRNDFADVERRWRERRLFGPPPRRRAPVGLWVVVIVSLGVLSSVLLDSGASLANVGGIFGF